MGVARPSESGGVQLVQIVDIAFEVVQSLDAQHRADRHGLAAAPRREQGIEVDRIGDRAELAVRSEEHTSELQSLMRISYAVFCLKKKTNNYTTLHYTDICSKQTLDTERNTHR